MDPLLLSAAYTYQSLSQMNDGKTTNASQYTESANLVFQLASLKTNGASRTEINNFIKRHYRQNPVSCEVDTCSGCDEVELSTDGIVQLRNVTRSAVDIAKSISDRIATLSEKIGNAALEEVTGSGPLQDGYFEISQGLPYEATIRQIEAYITAGSGDIHLEVNTGSGFSQVPNSSLALSTSRASSLIGYQIPKGALIRVVVSNSTGLENLNWAILFERV